MLFCPFPLPSGTSQLDLGVGASSSLEALGGLDPSSGLQAISTFPFVCFLPGRAPGRESEDHRREFSWPQARRERPPAWTQVVPAPPPHRPSSQPWKLLSWPPRSHTRSSCGLWSSVWGSTGILQSLLVHALKDLEVFPSS